ncbi:MAG: ribosome hibernation-promoting factor, HPF/YfiA family [Peptostreptococcaceae bacterium]
MRINISSRRNDLTELTTQYIEENLSRLERYIRPDSEIKAVINDRNEKIKLEVTIIQKDGPMIRAEEIQDDLYIATDVLYDKLYKQIIRYNAKIKEQYQMDMILDCIADNIEEDINIKQGIVVEKVKRFNLKPMSVEEAILQMELIGHSFYVFRNQDTFEINVTYKRKNGGYGIIEHE